MRKGFLVLFLRQQMISVLCHRGYTSLFYFCPYFQKRKEIDLKDSIICFKDYVNGRKKYYDDNGHGTHVAGIISGNGRKSGGKYKGIAPDSKLIIIKCLDYRGNGSIKSAFNGFK